MIIICFRQVACSGYQHKHWTSFLCLLWHVLYMLVPALSSGLTSLFGSNDSNTEHQQLPSMPILKPHPLLTTRGIVHIANRALHHSSGKLRTLSYGKYNCIILYAWTFTLGSNKYNISPHNNNIIFQSNPPHQWRKKLQDFGDFLSSVTNIMSITNWSYLYT